MTIDLSIIWRTTEGLFTSFLGALPRIGVAGVGSGLLWVIAAGVRSLERQYAGCPAGARQGQLGWGRGSRDIIDQRR